MRRPLQAARPFVDTYLMGFTGRLFSFFLPIFLISSHTEAAAKLTLHGKILKPDNTPVSSSSVSFQIEIRSPGVENCLLYQETQTLNLSSNPGVFNLSIGSGTRPASTVDGGFTLNQIFQNRNLIDLSAAPGACTNPTTSYTPAADDQRNISIQFNDGSGWQSVTAQKINPVPRALDSGQVGGYDSAQLLRVADGVPTAQTELSGAQWTELLAVISGTSTVYSKPNQLNGVNLPALSNGQTMVWNAGAWTAMTPQALPGGGTNGQVLTSDGAGGATWTATGANASSLTSGTLGDARLSSNVVLKNASNTFLTGNQNITNGAATEVNLILKGAAAQSTNMLEVRDSANTLLYSVETSGTPVANTDLANKAYVDSATSTVGANYVRKDGTTSLTGNWAAGNFDITGIKNIGTTGYFNQAGMAAPGVSAAGEGRIYFDSVVGKFKVSQNGGAYADLVGAGGAGDIADGGNTNGAAITIGTNDNYDLNFERNNATRLSLGLTGTGNGLLKFGGQGGGTYYGGTDQTQMFIEGTGTHPTILTLSNSLVPGVGGQVIEFYNPSIGFGEKRVAEINVARASDITGGYQTGSMSFNVTNDGVLANAMTVLGTGRVGIGTSSPVSNMHVKLPPVAGNSFVIEGDSTGSLNSPRIGFIDTFGGSVTTSPAWFFDNNRDEFRIFRQPNVSTPGTILYKNWLTGDAGVARHYASDGQTRFDIVVNSTLGLLSLNAANDSTSNPIDARITAKTFSIDTAATGDPQGSSRLKVDSAGNVGIGTTTPAAKMDVSGEVKVGNSGLSCANGTKGSIRYNTGSNAMEFCNGTSWTVMQASTCTDATPAGFAFANESNATISTLTASDIVQITGITCSVSVTVTGSGSPQIRICSDSACTSVMQDWTSSTSSIENNQYLQARLTSDSVGGSSYQGIVYVGSGATAWNVATAGGDCSASPTVGTVCADGTIYAGLSPDGNVKMYTTRCDVGQTWDGTSCTGARNYLPWNNGTGNWIATGITSTVTGKSNSAALYVLVDAASPYGSATYCETLNLNGKTDWYLPALGELNVLYSGRSAIRNFDTSGSWYWSSTDNDGTLAPIERFSDGWQDLGGKNTSRSIRCVRR